MGRLTNVRIDTIQNCYEHKIRDVCVTKKEKQK